MGAFEEFVNSNLGIRQPLIWDSVPPLQSPKAAGVLGSHFLDTSTNLLYEKTGYDDSIDWVEIGKLGDKRGGKPGGKDKHIQFNVEGVSDILSGSENFIYDYDLGLASGVSGHFDNLSGHNAIFSEDVHVLGDLYITGTSHVTKVVDYTVDGEISGKSGVFENLQSDIITGTTGYFSELYVQDGSIKDLEEDLKLVSGESLSSFLALSVDLYDTGKYIEERLDLVSGESFSSFLALSVDLYDSGQYLMENAGASKEEVGKLKIDLTNVSGESLANFISISDDVSVIDENLEFVSGGSLANFIAVSNDISSIYEKIDEIDLISSNDNGQNSTKINSLSGDFIDFRNLTNNFKSSTESSISNINSVINNLSEQEALVQLSGRVDHLSGESYTSFLTLTADLFESGEYLEKSLIQLSDGVGRLSGESYTSFLTLTADLFESGEYLEGKIDSGVKVKIQDDAPSSSNPGDFWWESDTGKLKIYYSDGTSSYWVDSMPASSAGGGGGSSQVLYSRFHYENQSPTSSLANSSKLGLTFGSVSFMDKSFGDGLTVSLDPTLSSILFDKNSGEWSNFPAGSYEVDLNILVNYKSSSSSFHNYNHTLEFFNGSSWKSGGQFTFPKIPNGGSPVSLIQTVSFSSVISFSNLTTGLNKLRISLDNDQSDQYYISKATITFKQLHSI